MPEWWWQWWRWWQVSAGRDAFNQDQLNTAIQQQRSQLAVCGLSTQSDVTSSAEQSLRHMSMTANPLSLSVYHACVKEEPVDSSYEQQQHRKAFESLTTMSGRNRGRGKATEPKYDCQICGDVAAGYHCGAYVCEACKVLFVRPTLCSMVPVLIVAMLFWLTVTVTEMCNSNSVDHINIITWYSALSSVNATFLV